MTGLTYLYCMTIPAYIEAQPIESQELLQGRHEAITSGDPSVVAEVGTMMRSEMIIYPTNNRQFSWNTPTNSVSGYNRFSLT
jgi:hypothetical protein